MNGPIRHLIIHGKTLEGQRFRPGDWAQRLAGVLSRFRPASCAGGPLSYSPYAMPLVIGDVPCVSIDYRLRGLEPLAWKFACDFAASNRLETSEETEGPTSPSDPA